MGASTPYQRFQENLQGVLDRLKLSDRERTLLLEPQHVHTAEIEITRDNG